MASRSRSAALRSVLGLVRSRSVARRGPTALVALAVAGAIVVVGSLFGLTVVTADQATREALAALPARERAIAVNRQADSSTGQQAADDLVGQAFEPLTGFAEPLLRATIYQERFGATTVVALDDVAPWVGPVTGRLPGPCDGGATCEAIRISSFELPDGTGSIGSTVDLGAIHVAVTGVARLGPRLPLDPVSSNGIVLLVAGRSALASSARTTDVARTSFWIAPLDPARTHAWTLDDLGRTTAELKRTLTRQDAAFVVNYPIDAIAAVEARLGTAVGRSILIGSLIVSVLLAFAVFAAAIERGDVGLEYRRLVAEGARRRQLAAFVAGEGLVSALGGAVVGWLVALAVVSAIGSAAGIPAPTIIQQSLLQPRAVALIGGIAGLSVLAVIIGIHPASRRAVRPRLVAVATIPVVLVLAWDQVSRGRADAAALAEQVSAPGTVLLPGLVGLTVILGSLVVLPPFFRRLARLAREAPLAVRLATVSIAQEPLRPAATMTLLAFSLGAAVFALAYSATLRQGAVDQAAFDAGMDLRFGEIRTGTSFGNDVLPLSRYAVLGSDIQVHPTIRLDATSATGRPLTILGLEPGAILALRGWRSDFAAAPPADLAAAIDQPGDWRLTGHPLPVGARQLSIDVQATGDPVRLTAVIARDDGEFDLVGLGDLSGGSQTLRADLFLPEQVAGLPVDYPSGWSIVALTAENGGPAAALGGASEGARQQADVTFRGLDGLIDPATPVHLDVSSGHARQLIRPSEPTDGLRLPAIVSPDLAHDVDSTGTLTIRLASDLNLPVRVGAVATAFPTLTDQDRGFVIIDIAPLLVALNADAPGLGAPNQVLIRTPDDGRTATIAAALSAEPFRFAEIRSRPALEGAQANDPFSVGVVWELLIGALAGIALSVAGIVIGALTDLRDERGEFGELEEQGITPRILERLAALRTAILVALGALSGTVVGTVMSWLVTAQVRVSANGRLPVPTLIQVFPWPAIGGLVVVIVAALSLGVSVIVRRHFAAQLTSQDPR